MTPHFIPHFIQRWFRSSRDRLGLDILLGQAPQATAPLRERLDWLGRLVNWVRTTGPGAAKLDLSLERLRMAHLRHVLQVLDRNMELKQRVAETLRSIIHDTSALELFLNVGIPNQQGFMGEVAERINIRILPQAPHDRDLISVFSHTFRFESDAVWIREMDSELLQGWLDLFHFSGSEAEPGWNTLIRDARDALHLMSHAVRSVGLSRLIRNRVSEPDFRNLSFFELTSRVDSLLEAQTETERTQAYGHFKKVLEECFKTVDEVYCHFRDHGVSISLVYQVERLKAQMRRVGRLGRLLAGYQDDPRFIQEFFGLLIQENIRARSLKGLLKGNMVLVCQKIVEANAETGEHYITRNRGEYFLILKKSWGGGAATAVTTLIKFALHPVGAAPFLLGLVAFANYSLSFVGMQLLGFTLATKQPAMTASALASRLKEASDSIEELVEEIVHLIRSQLAAVFGNVTAVIPSVIVIDFIYSSFGTHLTDATHAQHAIESFSILGPTPIYAAGTGVLLWISSVFSGAFYNWFCFRGLPEAIEHHPRLIYVFGAHRTQRFAHGLKANMAGFASSISLAFLLAMAPQAAIFFGIPFDVRHVTLSSGAMTASVLSLGPSILSEPSFWLALAGIGSMAVLNLGVSFVLALTVAIWAKRGSAPKRGVIYRALLKKFLGQPWIFFLPVSKPALVDTPTE